MTFIQKTKTPVETGVFKFKNYLIKQKTKADIYITHNEKFYCAAL